MQNGILNANGTIYLAPSASTFTETATSYVIGTVRNGSKYVGTGSATVMGLTISSGTDDLDTVLIERRDEAATFGSNTGIGHIWSIRPKNQPLSGRTVTLRWNARADNGKDISNLFVYRRPEGSNTWIKMNTTPLNGSSRSVSVTTYGFSDWTIGDINGPLPVTLSYFKGAKTKENEVTLSWATQTEINAQKFEVQKSIDGKAFTTIGTVQAAGNSNSVKNYNFTDVSVNASKAYYRLLQTDFDGASETFKTIIIDLNTTEKQKVTVAPNPFTDRAIVRYNFEKGIAYSLSIKDMRGNEVFSQTINATETTQSQELELANLTSGIYTLMVSSINSTDAIRILKK